MIIYIPKKSNEIYKETIAHRGFHYKVPENSLSAFKAAIKKHYAIEFDIRITKDNKIICIHDRHAKRLLGISGKISNMTYEQLKKYKILNSQENIPTLEEVLNLVSGKIPILIEVKGFFNIIFEEKLTNIIKKYNGRLYFHAKNLITYYRLRSLWKHRVFWILNPFRKRFNFLKSKKCRK
ncbi:MAG: glycerophosphodiester phosphodiesterase family protein [Clostridia bacterium]